MEMLSEVVKTEAMEKGHFMRPEELRDIAVKLLDGATGSYESSAITRLAGAVIIAALLISDAISKPTSQPPNKV